MSTVLVTGASRGIGAACALGFAKAGYDVAVNYCHSKDSAIALTEEIKALGVRAFAVCTDVSDSAQVKAMFEAVRAELGAVEVLVNNAGISHAGLLTDMTDDEWKRLMDTDLSGTFYCCREGLRDMLRAHSGVIVNIASMWGEVGASCEVAYSAAKAGGGRLVGRARQRRVPRGHHDGHDGAVQRRRYRRFEGRNAPEHPRHTRGYRTGGGVFGE